VERSLVEVILTEYEWRVLCGIPSVVGRCQRGKLLIENVVHSERNKSQTRIQESELYSDIHASLDFQENVIGHRRLEGPRVTKKLASGIRAHFDYS
jgi:hypothetical protein